MSGGRSNHFGAVLSDRDQPRIVGGEHRVALARHEDVRGNARKTCRRPDADWNATVSGSAYAPLHSRTREPGAGELSAVTLGPAQVGLQHRAGGRIVDSQPAQYRPGWSRSVVWSSASRVTVVPASVAAAQIARAWS